MKSYTHFTLSERICLQENLNKGKSMREIARILERSPSSISREIKRNKSKYKPHRKNINSYWYNHWRAQNLYIRRKRDRKRTALTPDSDVWNYIVEHLLMFWSPEEISNRWAMEHPTEKKPCVSTIYRYIKQGLFPKVTVNRHLRRRGKRIQTRNANYNSIQPDRIIPDWSEIIRLRLRIGDWEGDTVYGGVGKGLLVTMVDRKSRFVKIGLLKKRTAEDTKKEIIRILKDLPVESISLDNGSEFSEFRELEKELQAPVYFAEPHKPWQRGTNENTNDLIRFFFPKGYDFRETTEEEIQKVEDLLNNRPRKCLAWKTPAEVFFAKSVALD